MPDNKKPIKTSDRRKVQAYQDSLNAYNSTDYFRKEFIKNPYANSKIDKPIFRKNMESVFTEYASKYPKNKPIQAINYLGDKRSDGTIQESYSAFPLWKKPEQPYEYQKENIAPLVPKKAKLSIQEPTDTLKKVSTVNTNTSSEPKEKVIKKSPFAQYPNMKKKIEKFNNSQSFVSGAKSVKQYRGDENLPEARNGMKKGCGCKHSKTKYKYQEGTEDVELDMINALYPEETKQAKKPAVKVAPKPTPKPVVKTKPIVKDKKVAQPVDNFKYTAPKNTQAEADSVEKANTASRYKYLKNLEEQSRKQDSTYYANNIGRQIDRAVENNTRVYVTENREGKPLKGKKSGDNTCITGVCNVAKKGGAKIPFNSALAEDRNSVGDNPIQTRYNPAFRDNAASMGFKLLPQNAKMQRGDIVQLNEKGTPHHAMLYYDEGTAGSRFGNDVGNDDDGRSWFGLGPKKDLGFEKRWMGPFSNRTSSSMNPIAKNALAYRYMGVPSKKASMNEAVAYGKAEKAKYLKNQELLARRNAPKVAPKETPKNLVAMEDPMPNMSEAYLQKNGNKNIMSNKMPKYKYKYGSGAITIPEGSAIVTANGGKNKQALMAYKKGNYKLLNNIIEKMPEDNGDKAQDGKKLTKVKGKYTTTDPTTKETYQEESVHGGGGGYGKEMSLDKAQNLYNLTDEQFEAAYGKNKKSDTYKIEKGRREAVKKGNVTYNVAGKQNKDGTLMDYASGYRSKPGEGEKKKEGDDDKGKIPTPIPPPTTTGGDDTGGRKGFPTIPSMAEIAARGSILGQGVEGVPENYLKLGRYNYASQLPQTLREIQLSEQAGRESARDIVAGDAGKYLAQSGSLSASRMKANNAAVVQDTLARQDILNKNVDLGNEESKVNLGLKNQYAALRGQARSAYNDQLIGLGQRIDSATETAQEMSNQKDADAQRMQILKDLGQNYEYKNVNGLMQLVPKVPTNTPAAATTTTAPAATGKKGLKRLKTYKRN